MVCWRKYLEKEAKRRASGLPPEGKGDKMAFVIGKRKALYKKLYKKRRKIGKSLKEDPVLQSLIASPPPTIKEENRATFPPNPVSEVREYELSCEERAAKKSCPIIIENRKRPGQLLPNDEQPASKRRRICSAVPHASTSSFRSLNTKEKPFDLLPYYKQRGIPSSTKEWVEMMNSIHCQAQAFLCQVRETKERPFDSLPNYEKRENKRRRVCPDVPSSKKEWVKKMNMIHHLSLTPSRRQIPFSASELQSARRLLKEPPKFEVVNATTTTTSTDWDVDSVADYGGFAETTEEIMTLEIETVQQEESSKRSRRRKTPSSRKQRPTRASARLASKGLGSGFTRSGRRFSLRLANMA